jgi:antirestriction protein ArdC
MSERVYETVAKRTCELLETGTVPWHQPWNAELGLPRSLSTGELYRGVNIRLPGWSSIIRTPDAPGAQYRQPA